MLLYLLRGAFILLAASVIMLYVLPFQAEQELDFVDVVLMLGVTLGISLTIIAADAYVRHKNLSALSGIFLGLIAGLVVAFALSFVVDLFGVLTAPKVTMEKPQISWYEVENMPKSEEQKAMQARLETYQKQVADHDAYLKLLQGLKVLIGLITCYLCMSLVMQTHGDFRFVIPYVEFAKEIRGNRPTLLDTSVIIDGRILDIAKTQIIQGTFLVPKFVLNELQLIADSPDSLRRSRGRRGLDILRELQQTSHMDVAIDEREVEAATVDQKLVAQAQSMRARIMTNDYNLNKVATLHGVDVININDLAKAMRPVALPGEPMHVKIIKPGEGNNQGIGYLEDGTMIVVENTRSLVGQEVDLTVTSMLQTTAGRMIFGRLNETHGDDEQVIAPESTGARPSGRNPRRTT